VGIAFELAFSVLLVYALPLQRIFGTSPPPAEDPLVLVLFPLVVWCCDEL
jgi:hypothetical protein